MNSNKFLQKLKFLIQYSYQETSRRKCYYIISLFACFIVSIIALIINSFLSQANIIFLLLAEESSGEIDVKLSVSNVYQIESSVLDYRSFYSFLNYSLLVETSNDNENLESLSTGRLYSIGLLYANETNFINNINIYFIDLNKEKRMSLGRSFPDELLELGEDECYISSSIANELNITESQMLGFKYRLDKHLKNRVIEIVSNSSLSNKDNSTKIFEEFSQNQYDMINTSFKVKKILSKSYGKFQSKVDKFVIIDINKYKLGRGINSFLELYFKGLNLSKQLNNTKLIDYSEEIMINFPSNRIQNYIVNDYNELILKVSSHIESLSIKGSNIDISYPVSIELKPLFTGMIFLGIILNLIVIILFGLSILLITSILSIILETSTLNLAIIRLIGLDKSSFVTNIITQCLMFSVPGFILAYLFHFLVLKLLSNVITKLFLTETSLSTTPGAFIYAFLLCNLSPLIAIIKPVKSILNKSICTSINSSLSKTGGVKIEIISLFNRERNMLISFGVLCSLYGMCIYYFLPLSLLSLNFSMLLAIFLWILVGMLLGLILLVSNIDVLIQKLLSKICLFWSKKHLLTIITSNLISHRVRNRSTSLMFSLSIAVFIMLIISTKIENSSGRLNNIKRTGADVILKSTGSTYINSKRVNYLLEYLVSKKIIIDYSYATPSIESICCRTEVINIGKSTIKLGNIQAVSPNFNNITYKEFLLIEEQSIINRLDKYPSENLYMIQNKGSIIGNVIAKKEINQNVNNPFILKVNSDDSPGPNETLLNEFMIFRLLPSTIQEMSPFYLMSFGGLSTDSNSDVKSDFLCSFWLYSELLSKITMFFYEKSLSQQKKPSLPITIPYDELPIDRIFLKFEDNISTVEALSRFNKIKLFLSKSDLSLSSSTFYDKNQTLERNESIILFIFYGISMVILFFCFFNLSTTMIININEQQNEIAIYRSLGLTKSNINFVYISESFILVLSSCLVGLVVGMTVGWTILLQRLLFTKLPIKFMFPYVESMFIVIISFIGGFLCSFFTIRKFSSKQITVLLKE